MNEKELLGIKIKSIRKTKKITQETLAEKADLSLRQIVKIENGQAIPTVFNLQKIACALNTSIESLLNNKSYDSLQNIKKGILEKIENLDENNLRFVYRFLSAIN